MGLTKLQRAFIDRFCEDPKCGKAEAARRAGYSPKRAEITAIELMKHPEVLREIERRVNKKVERVEVTDETVADGLLDVIEECMAAGPGAWQMTARLRALELLGKWKKMFTDRVEHGIDDALIEKLLEGRKRAGALRPEELKAEIVRGHLPAAPTVAPGELNEYIEQSINQARQNRRDVKALTEKLQPDKKQKDIY